MVRTGPGEGTSYRGRVHSPHRSIGGHGSGSQYALCTLGVGLIALGVVMIVWTVVPLEPVYNVSSVKPLDGSPDSRGKTSSVAFVLLAVGLAMLLLAICLALRNKRRQRVRDPHETNSRFLRPTEGAADAMEETPSYDVPSYEEAVGSGQYPVRQSNLRMSTSQLPSYEDLVAAVQNETILQEAPCPASAPAPVPGPAPGPASAPVPAAARRSGRSSRLLRPLLARRIKSEKLSREMHLDIQSLPPGGQVTIEPLTPPPQYEEKMPEL